MLAAMLTAANLGPRPTGWGFVLFTIGSLCWALIGLTSGQSGLLYTNAFLVAVNALGVWRWLGRKAAFEEGGQNASVRSRLMSVPSLFSFSGVMGQSVAAENGASLGKVVDAMASCSNAKLAYIVVSEGGIGGVGERLHAIHPDWMKFDTDNLVCKLTSAQVQGLPVLDKVSWPAEVRRELE